MDNAVGHRLTNKYIFNIFVLLSSLCLCLLIPLTFVSEITFQQWYKIFGWISLVQSYVHTDSIIYMLTLT